MPTPPSLLLDPEQASVIELADGVSASVLGAPGTGKTTTLMELVADRVHTRGWSPDAVLALTTSRASATRLRDALAARLGVPTSGPLARTVNSLAYEIVGHAARRAGAVPPRLVTGGEQDADIAAILEGHELDGSGPAWPERLSPEVRRLRGFRTELRELMARVTEQGLTPEGLRRLGVASSRDEWVAAADFMAEYLDVVSTTRPSQLDAAELGRFAVRAIEAGEAGDRVDALRLVLVDDLQEAPQAALSVLAALARRGVAVIAFGDPDVAANAFRGGEPDALGRLTTVLGVPVETAVLHQVHGRHPAIVRLTSTVTQRIGTAAAGQQRRVRLPDAAPHIHTAEPTPAAAPTPAAPPAPHPTVTPPPTPHPPRPALLRIEGTTPPRVWTAIARVLREEHLLHGTPWSELAVVVRSGAAVPALARALALSDVPTRTTVGGSALRDDRAAGAMLQIVAVAIGHLPLTPDAAEAMLTGPFGGLDRLALRRLRLALRAEELAGDGRRSSDALLVEALGDPARFASIDHRIGRAAARFATLLAELRRGGATIEELLWTVWERSGLATVWGARASGTGVIAAEANRDLDGVVALFAAAKRFVERRPEATPVDFIAETLEAEVPEDMLAPARDEDSVLVATPSAMVGGAYRVVVVAALQDGVWPNLRPRGSLLAPQELPAAVAGIGDVPIDRRRLVLDDELRMFALAVSRASERVVLAAVANDDESPSVLLSLLPPGAPVLDAATARPLSLRGAVGRLRRTLVTRSSGELHGAAAASLAALAAEGVPGAAPREWHGLVAPSSTGPLFEGAAVPISPSRLERFEESPLDWFVETVAGSDPGIHAHVGTIVHWAMETADDVGVDALWAAAETRWHELLFDAPWLEQRQRRIMDVFFAALSEYLRDTHRDGKVLVGAERRFRLDLEGIDVSGSIDRVERAADGSVVIIDLKTGTPITKQTAIDEHAQLGVYQLAYAHGLLDEVLAEHGTHAPGGAKLLYVKSGVGGRAYREAVQAPFDEVRLDAVRERIRQVAAGMAAAEFTGLVELTGWGRSDIAGLQLQRVPAVSSD